MIPATGPEHASWNELGSLSALGLLDATEAAQWSEHFAHCEICQADERQTLELIAGLALAAPLAEPPAGLRNRLLALAGSAPSTNKIVRAQDGKWTLTPFPGVDVRSLSSNPDTGDMTSLVRMAPGAVYAPHRHGGNEHCYVLSGDLVFEDHTLFAGDYSVSPPGTTHSRATSKQGCMLLIVHNVADEILVVTA